MSHEHERRRQQIGLELEAASADARRASRAATLSQRIGFAASAVGLLVFFAGMSLWERANHRVPMAAHLCLFSGCGLAAFPIGIVSGWLAHRMFYRTEIPVPVMTIAFALLIDFTIFGWIIVRL